jgi:hypothetical protein
VSLAPLFVPFAVKLNHRGRKEGTKIAEVKYYFVYFLSLMLLIQPIGETIGKQSYFTLALIIYSFSNRAAQPPPEAMFSVSLSFAVTVITFLM